jgi:hypothetical protein
MKNLMLVAAIVFAGSSAFASGKCESKSGTGVFCDGKNKSSCEFFADSCDWNETQEVIVRVEKSEKEKSCTSKEGKEAHESFCAGNDKFSCKAHTGLCEWK